VEGDVAVTSGDVEAHPVVAALAASMERSDAGVSFPLEAFEKVRAALRASPAPDAILVHLIALGMKTHRIAGPAGNAVLGDITLLVAEVLGSAQAAADRFATAGLDKATAARLGAEVANRAPPPAKTAAPTVKAKRGLS
jgi:hypothetical protein